MCAVPECSPLGLWDVIEADGIAFDCEPSRWSGSGRITRHSEVESGQTREPPSPEAI